MEDIIIIDNGSYSCKYGYGEREKPEGEVRSVIYYNKKKRRYKIANEKVKERKREYPIRNGVIQDIEKMKVIWDEIIYRRLKIKPKEKRIMLSMIDIEDEKYNEKIKKMMLEEYKFKEVGLVNQQILSLNGSERERGIIVDIGYDITRIVAIYDNYLLKNTLRISNISGRKINEYIKEKKKIKGNEDEIDKKKRKILKKEKIWEEIIMRGDIIEKIRETIEKSPIDYKKELKKNIIIIGGTSTIKGLCKKISEEIKKKEKEIKIRAYKNRKISSWKGGIKICKEKKYEKMWEKK